VSASGFNELIHQSTRLSIMALLAAADWADFAFLCNELTLSESALSKQLSTLEEAGYVTIERPVSNHRRRVRAKLSAQGLEAFQGHVRALQAIVTGAASRTTV
jgi:DNA-binding MarR family transcriptional regulator